MPEPIPSPQTQRSIDFVSPNIDDIIFSQPVESRKVELDRPAYGTLFSNNTKYHDGSNKYANHILCGIVNGRQVGSSEGYVYFVYAATRASQHLYNFEVSNEQDNDWPRLTQEWYVLRSAYSKGMTTGITAPPGSIGGTWTRTGDVQQRIKDEAIDAIFVKMLVFYRDISTTLVDYEQDPETNDLVKITRQIIATTNGGLNPAPTVTTGREVSQQALGLGFSLLTTRSINDDSLPTAYSRKEHVPFTVPRILTGINFAVGTDGLSLTLNPVCRGGYEKLLQGRRAVDFSAADPTSSVLYQIIPTHMNYRGTYFNVPFGDMVTDAIVNLGSSGGTFTEEVDFAASTPTASEYIADIGEEKLWAEKTDGWRFNLIRRDRTYVFLE